jgi:hypothetical protein
MRANIPGFLEELFDHENFEIRFDFQNDKIFVKDSSHKMQNVSKEIHKLLNDNINVLKEAYLKDIKKKFPAQLIVDLNSLNVELEIEHGLAMYSKFLSNIFQTAFRNHNLKEANPTYTVEMLKEYFINSKWTKRDKMTYSKEIKNAEELQFIFSQLYHMLDDKTDVPSHIKKWKDFFKA